MNIHRSFNLEYSKNLLEKLSHAVLSLGLIAFLKCLFGGKNQGVPSPADSQQHTIDFYIKYLFFFYSFPFLFALRLSTFLFVLQQPSIFNYLTTYIIQDGYHWLLLVFQNLNLLRKFSKMS